MNSFKNSTNNSFINAFSLYKTYIMNNQK